MRVSDQQPEQILVYQKAWQKQDLPQTPWLQEDMPLARYDRHPK